MLRLFILFVFFCSIFFVGCASTTTGFLNVSTPSGDDEYVLQVDSVVTIVNGAHNAIKLDTGLHAVKVSFAGKPVVDTLVHVKGVGSGNVFLSFIGALAFGTGLMTYVWSGVWLVVVPAAAGVSTFIMTSSDLVVKSSDKVQLHAIKQSDEITQLHQSERLYLRVWDLHPNLNISEKFGVSSVLHPSGFCYDRRVNVVWVQSEANSRVYPLDLRKKIEVCLLDADGERLSCESTNNRKLEDYPCR